MYNKDCVVCVKNLKKSYRVEKGGLFRRSTVVVKAVRGISFDVVKGEFVGFIGPNGSGKTTTLKCLSGLLVKDSGSVRVLGFNPEDRNYDFLRRFSLVMGNKSQLWWELPAVESFLLNKEIYEIDDCSYKCILDEMVSVLGIKDVVGVPVRKLSLGERMKCELVVGLLHTPELVFLDEPTLGLDVVYQDRLRCFLRDYRKEYGATIMLTSHNVVDIDSLCNRVVVINSGCIVFDGDISELRSRKGGLDCSIRELFG